MGLRKIAIFLCLIVLGTFYLSSKTSGLTVHIVPHTHDDVGWLKTVDQYYMGLNNSIQHAAVRFIVTSVLSALERNPERKFVYVEQAFFQRWWRQATDDEKTRMKAVVASRQLEFINGGWCMHDEAASHFIDMVDQTTLGHQFIVSEFGDSAIPTIGWQIDPFGHSATQASLLSGVNEFDGLFFGRIDYQDHAIRMAGQNLEFIWRGSASLGDNAQVFTGAFQSGNYGPPGGFCWDYFCGDPAVQDDPNLEDYNLPSRVNDFVNAAMMQAGGTRGDLATMNIMWTMGSDFQHENAEMWFLNLDKIIKAVNADGRVTAQYSTPSIYLKAKHDEGITWNVKTDDFFPYADGADSYWTGYFTSRPALKRYIRQNSAFLQVARHLESFVGGASPSSTERLWEALSVAQHHDSVSGTAKQHVTYDYAKRISIGASIADQALEHNLATLVSVNGGSLPTFTYCPRTNESYCPPTQSGNQQVIVLYNPLVHTGQRYINLPVNSMSWSVQDTNGNTVTSQIIPTFQNNGWNSSYSAPYTLHFLANMPALGFSTYFLVTGSGMEPVPSDMESASVSILNKPKKVASRKLLSISDQANVLSSNVWSLSFSSNGLLANATWLATKKVYPIVQDFAWYNATMNSKDQNDGAYIFRPFTNEAFPFSSAKLSIVQGPVVAEARQQYNDWITQTIRLYADRPEIEFEWTVGPVDISDGWGKDVIIRFNSSIQSNSTWYTDANGRDFQTRIRNYRPTWKWTPTQPIAGNYYPVNAIQYLNDSSDAMVILNDRSQAGASFTDGELEFMIHRRLLQDDGRGVGEPLNETQGISPDGRTRYGHGLIITGTHWLRLIEAENATLAARTLQHQMYFPPHRSYADLSGSPSDYLNGHIANFSFALNDLPENLVLTTLQAMEPGQYIIRIAHKFGVGENPVYSQPVTVDLAKIALPPIATCTEMNLAATRPAGQHKPYSWNTTSLTEPVKSGSSLQGTQFTINPMEVRTFAVTFQQ